MRRFGLVLLVLAASGCHAKFKKEAPTLGSVRTQIITTGGPVVQLGHLGTVEGNSGLAALANIAVTAVNITQDIKAGDVAGRIGQAVRTEDVNHAFNDGIAQTLQSGPPFAYSDDPNAPATLQVEVLSYGLSVPYLGAPGVFTYDLKVRIYKKDGDRVYKARHSCEIGAGTPGVTESVLGVVNNVKEIKNMSDADINASFEAMSAYCAQTFVIKMRKHAG